MILGVSYDLLRWEERNLIDEAKKAGNKVIPLFTKDLTFLSSEDAGYQDMEAVIQRNTSHSRASATSMLFETYGFKVFNDSLTLNRCENKLLTTFLLRSRGVAVPRTAIAFSRERALEIAGKLGYPVVIKPIEGSWGRMVARAQDEDTLRSLIEYQEFTTLQYKTIFYIQEYVNKPDRDIRIFVIGDEAPVGIYRENPKNWKTNTALGAIAKPLKIDEELRELALKVKEVIGGFFLGIDIFEDKERGYLVGEVNGVPEYKNTVRVNQFNVSGFLLNKLTEVIKK
ncbi:MULTISPECIES: lysine biosynthesis protein LysX [Metallosphaera]|uniref:lysine biosynthesis protein LysX n=1 Tax=Metallosphaera TaxID=41980 RepID=UPI001F0516EB|nr:lysine biosynthesis protein LysX [Metallosphaera sedula]MCH1770925.1 lysine biosynthesis protein LysX [Metallosphaera sedula]MCP6729282.1 lysine biosynthesis protein LysX [Metallosphaera sedula]